MLLPTLSILLAFQNCAGPAFQAQSGTAFCVSNLADASCNHAKAVDCVFNGQTLTDGQTIIAYLNSTAAYGTSCQSQKRTCSGGVLSGNYNFSTCAVAAAKSCLFNGLTIASGSSVTAYLSSSAAAGENCQSQTRVCNDGALSGQYAYGACQNQVYSSCLFNGVTIAHGQTVTAYLASQVPYGQSCHAQQRTCYNGSLSGSGDFGACAMGAPASCLFNGQTIPSGQNIQGYAQSTVPYGSTCAANSRTCNNGVLSGSGDFASCSVGQPAACIVNGQTIPSGGSIQLYFNPVDPVCASQTRSCNNGVLSGTASFSSCQIYNPSVLDTILLPGSKTQYYALRSQSTGQFVTLANDTSLIATGGMHPSSAVLFKVTRVGGDGIALTAPNGKLVSASNSGAGSLMANQSQIGSAETFHATDMGTGYISLTSDLNKQIVTTNNGSAPLIANRSTAAAWEALALMPVIDMQQVLTAFADRHPNQAKQRSFRDQHSGVDWVHNAIVYERRTVPTANFGQPGIWNQLTVAQVGDADHAPYTINDWYYMDDNFVGFHGTLPDDPSQWTIWSPQIHVAARFVTPDMDGWFFDGSYDNASGITPTPTAGWCPFPDVAHAGNQGCFKNVIHFTLIDTQGAIGSRWVITSGGDPSQTGDMPLETWTYDLGPSAGVYDPEFSAIGYQQRRMFQDYNSWTTERYGTVIDYTTAPTCRDHFFCY